MSKIKRIINSILCILFPHTCPFCGKVEGQPICQKCLEQIEYIKEPRCKRCGKPLRYAEHEYCYDCAHQNHYYEEGRSLWVHKPPVTWSIYQFKYHNRRIYGVYYGEELAKHYGELLHHWGVELLIPIPLHKKKYRKRGYNQAEIIAKQLSIQTGIPMSTTAVFRQRYTKPQKVLDHRTRSRNMNGAFRLAKTWKGSLCVALIDDIYTTGSTIDAVARLFIEAGVEKVYFLTVSIGQGF
ncbi:MAG: ComF family protein [Lachnospiraceae bacterium]